MNYSQQQNFIISGSIGSLIAFVALIVMALLTRTFIAMDHFSILSGLKELPTEQLVAYKSNFALNLTWDSLYLFGHILMWFGYSAKFHRESKGLATIVAMLGLLSGLLDFTENEIRWSALNALISGGNLPISRIVDWQTIYGLSFWALFICSLICAIAGLGRTKISKAVFFIAALGMLIAPLNYQFGFLPAFLWIIAWHAISAIFLWSSHKNIFIKQS